MYTNQRGGTSTGETEREKQTEKERMYMRAGEKENSTV